MQMVQTFFQNQLFSTRRDKREIKLFTDYFMDLLNVKNTVDEDFYGKKYSVYFFLNKNVLFKRTSQ